MNRTHRYTILSLLLAAAFIFVSMVSMRIILQVREGQLLTERGKTMVESPVQAWQEWEEETQTDMEKQLDGQRHTLTIGQMEEAIKHWNGRLGEIIHDPVEGQISLEEAIEAGESWLSAMGMEEDKSRYSVNTSLGVGVQMESDQTRLEPYYSFWTVQISTQTMDTMLNINAVTGQVWSAVIRIYENIPEEPTAENLKIFVKSTGLLIEDTPVIEKNSERIKVVSNIKDSRLNAQVVYHSLNYEKSTIVSYYEESVVSHEQSIVIIYDIIVNEK